jgi:hypothetical protein
MRVSIVNRFQYLFSSIVTCPTLQPAGEGLHLEGLDAKLPLGWYRIGNMQIRHDTSWFNLYRRRASGEDYWDFYTNIPERNCIGFVMSIICVDFI